MQPIYVAVQHSTFSSSSLPIPVRVIFTPIYRIHRYIRFFRKASHFQNPQSFCQLAAGHTLDYFLGQNKLIRFVATCVLISNRIDECIQDAQKLSAAFEDFKNCFKKGVPNTNEQVAWVTDSSNPLLSPATSNLIKSKKISIFDRIKRICICFARLFTYSILLSSSIIAACEAFAFTPEAQSDSIRELFLKTSCQHIDTLIKNQQRMHDVLVKNKKTIKQVLRDLHSPVTAKMLIKASEKAIGMTKGVKTVTEVGNGVLVDLGKSIIYNAAVICNIEERATAFKPNEKAPWERGKKNQSVTTPAEEWPTASLKGWDTSHNQIKTDDVNR